jgi:hypothetical protein
MAYTQTINQNSTDSHQTSPAYMLTFLPWANRDTAHFGNAVDGEPSKNPIKASSIALTKPIIVINDCVSVTVNSNKSSHIHSANMILLAGDINYATALAPGDFVLINLVNDDSKLFGKNCDPNGSSQDSLYYRARHGTGINKKNDGFKGVFKIQSVRRVLQVSPEGVKTFHYQISAAAFTEFNQVVYFNPYLFNQTPENTSRASDILNTSATAEWSKAVDKNYSNLSKVFKALIGFLIGTGFPADYAPQKEGVVVNHNKTFEVPTGVGELLSLKKRATGSLLAADLFNYYVGIEKYNGNAKTATEGLNPTIVSRDGNFSMTGKELSGVIMIQPEPWGQVSTWSILGQYSNSLLNELYTSFKLQANGTIMPTVVLRQKPFNSKYFVKNNPSIDCTEFLSLPRWRISPDLITSLSLGRDEAVRINFVHVVGKVRSLDIKSHIAQQAAANLHQHDSADITRNGLRPFIASCDFDFPTESSNETKAGAWNKLVFDWLNDGHLKENGTLVCAGLPQAISVGDNIQIQDTVLHIESVQHNMQMTPDGKKTFRTTLQLSYGIDVRSLENSVPLFPESNFPDADDMRKNDFNHKSQSKNDGMLPGVSDTQDVGGRKDGNKSKSKSKIPNIPKF